MATALLPLQDSVTTLHYEPQARFDFCGTLVEGKLIIYGGRSFEHDTGPPRYVDLLDISSGRWKHVLTSGIPPNAIYGVAHASIGTFVYAFGGGDEERSYYDTLHRFDIYNKVWTILEPTNSSSTPTPKIGASMIVYKKLLVMFGGHYFSNSFKIQMDDIHRLVCYDIDNSKSKYYGQKSYMCF